MHMSSSIEESSNPNRKRGIIVFYGEYPGSSSWGNRINNISKIFNQLKFDYRVIIPYPPKTIKSVNISDDRIIRLQIINKEIQNFICDIFYYIKGIVKSFFFIKNQKQLDFLLFAGGSFMVCYPIILLCKHKGIKVWIDIVDENSKKFEKKKSLRDYLAIFNKEIFDIFLIPKFDKVLVISNYLYNKYRKNVSSEILQKSLPTIIDIKEFDANTSKSISNKSKELDQILSDRRLKMLYGGSIVRPNGIFFVLDCVAELILKLNYDFLIIIIALMGDKEIIFKYANDKGIVKNLLILDKQDQSDMPAIYKQIDILFLPEHGNIIANAGFPGKTAELLASGKPIIATIFSDLEKYLKNGVNAFLSPIGDKEKYMTNLKKLIDEEDLRKKIGSNGRRTAENEFDYKSCTSMFADL